jgi:hypothetical protein
VKRPGDSIYFMDLDELLPLLGRYTVLILNPRFTELPITAADYASIEMTSVWSGRTIAAMQVWDILRTVEWAFTEEKLTPSAVSIYGKGPMGIAALYAGLRDPRVNHIILNDAPASHWQGPALLNVLRVTDIPEAAALFAPRRLTSFNRLPESFDYTRSVYKLERASPQLVVAGSLPEALFQWKKDR